MRSNTPSPKSKPKSKPKVKGCLQCSKRRIICDLGQPHCRKCTLKGLDCSGPNRIRFALGVASRGRFKDSPIPVVRKPHGPLLGHSGGPANSSSIIGAERHPADPVPVKSSGQIATDAGVLTTSQPSDRRGTAESAPLVSPGGRQSQILGNGAWPLASPGPRPWLPPVGHHARQLLYHFSTAVAPAMVVVDGASNGYREMILPLACHDGLLQRTVGVVAAQHLGQARPEVRSAAERGRRAIIDRLQRDSACSESVFSMVNWATLIVLLVGETVTGGPDFGPLLRMLLLTSQHCDASSMPLDLYRFLKAQTQMFEILARPQLNEQEGIELLSQPGYTHMLDWIPHEQGPATSVPRQAFAEAFQLYLNRATRGAVDTRALMGRLRSTVSLLEPEDDGGHALVWPCFVASIESEDPEDRTFFTQRLERIFCRTRFGNIRAAIDLLPSIWDLKRTRSWTSCLSDISPGLIM